MKKLGSPNDISSLVLFLLSPGAQYITGDILKVHFIFLFCGFLLIKPEEKKKSLIKMFFIYLFWEFNNSFFRWTVAQVSMAQPLGLFHLYKKISK